MTNAGEEEDEAEEEDERRGRDKAADAASVTSKKRASESEVTVNKELMKQLENVDASRETSSGLMLPNLWHHLHVTMQRYRQPTPL